MSTELDYLKVEPSVDCLSLAAIYSSDISPLSSSHRHSGHSDSDHCDAMDDDFDALDDEDEDDLADEESDEDDTETVGDRRRSSKDGKRGRKTSSSAKSSHDKDVTGAGPGNKARYKHVPHRDKPVQVVARRNARERRRVQTVNSAFSSLRKHIPYENRHKRLSKVKTLRIAISYINELQAMLKNHDSLLDGLVAGTGAAHHVTDYLQTSDSCSPPPEAPTAPMTTLSATSKHHVTTSGRVSAAEVMATSGVAMTTAGNLQDVSSLQNAVSSDEVLPMMSSALSLCNTATLPTHLFAGSGSLVELMTSSHMHAPATMVTHDDWSNHAAKDIHDFLHLTE